MSRAGVQFYSAVSVELFLVLAGAAIMVMLSLAK
jgi:hypothetical protein